DRDAKRRPAVPREHFIYPNTGAHWKVPERQTPAGRRERSTEHAGLTPVFGTSCPPRGLSGTIRRLAYARYSEGRTAHWLLLMLADRVDVLEGLLGDALRGRPDNPLAEYGLRAELRGHGLRSRLGRHRADVRRMPLELLLLAGSSLVLGGLVTALRARRRRTWFAHLLP
ncbi:MAG TPA: hypothetical protein VKW77_02350, partial [Acidimicrobiales bacterium]|nr:hypothetical protein [Acidimicrobiales bacterium]